MIKTVIYTIFGLFCTVSVWALDQPVSVSDTGKTSNEAEAAYDDQRQRSKHLSKNEIKRSLYTHKKYSKKHLGQRRHFSWKPKKQQELQTISFILLGMFALSLLVGLGLIASFLSLFWATITLGSITLLALVLPFIDDIGFDKSFFQALVMFLFGYIMGRITLFTLAFWLAKASLMSAGIFVIIGSIIALLGALLGAWFLYLLWKAIKAFFRLIILILTLGLVDIDK
ncbi:hypothetical protein BKI52_20120 [marine bacterium AO1-C]|nr:hypothetical protein BKI52_20120 [marine bacterium AO1-C]